MAIGTLLLSIVSFFDIPIGNDEGGWGYIGRAWADGQLLPYSGIADNKTPGIFYLNYLSYSLFGTNIWFLRLLALVSTVLTAFLIYLIGKHIANSRVAVFSMAIFIFLMPLPAVDGSYAQTETFMNLFVAAAFYFLISSEAGSKRMLAVFLSGLCLGIAVAFRQSAVISIIPLLFTLSFLKHYDWKRFFTGAGVFFFGAITATALSILPYIFSGGQFTDYLNGAWLFFLRGDVGVVTGGLIHRLSGFATRFFGPEIFLPASSVLMLCVYFRKMRNSGIYFVVPLLVWALFDFFSYNLEGTYFPHHLKLLALSWSISFGFVADFFLRKFFEERVFYGPFVVAALFVFYVFFQNSYYATARAFMKGASGHDFRDIGAVIKNMTKRGDTIYAYGLHTGPIYYYSSRNSPSRYFETQQLAMPGALAELQANLLEKQPKIILTSLGETPPPWLQTFVAEHYTAEAPQYGYAIYKNALTE